MADKGGRRRQRGRVLALHRAIKKADEEKIEGESSNQKLIPVALASLRFSVCSYAERRQRQRQTTAARGHVGRRDALREKKQPQGEKRPHRGKMSAPQAQHCSTLSNIVIHSWFSFIFVLRPKCAVLRQCVLCVCLRSVIIDCLGRSGEFCRIYIKKT